MVISMVRRRALLLFLLVLATAVTVRADDNGEIGPIDQGTVPESSDFEYAYDYTDLGTYEPWPVGTKTLLEFTDGWYEGQIKSFTLSDDKKNATYIVEWSDGSSDTFLNELEWMDLMVANAADYQPWEIGTPTFGYPNPETVNGEESQNSFLDGKITAFQNGAYTVTWSNGDIVVYNDFDVVDELVNNAGTTIDPSFMANYQPWPMDTAVSWDFDDGWWDGTITGFTKGTYEVTWSDGSTKYYSNLEKIDQMVSFATGEGFIGNLADSGTQYDENLPYDGNAYGDDNMYGDYYDIQTLVYAEFADGWWVGYIDSYEGDYYLIRWSDDSTDTFLPGDDMDEMVINSQNIPYDYTIYPVGTEVYKKFDGTWYWGEVEYSNGGFYQILWDDGQRTVYVSGLEIDQMVARAYGSGIGAFGKFALTIVGLGIIGGIAFFVLRRNNRKKQLTNMTEQVRENELDLAEGNETDYSDRPAEGAKPGIV